MRWVALLKWTKLEFRMRLAVPIFALILVGCSFSGPNGNGDGDGDGDGACDDFTPRRFFTACEIEEIGQPSNVTLASGTYLVNTMTGAWFRDDGPIDPLGAARDLGDISAHVVVVNSFVVPEGTTIRAVGTRPLVVISLGEISVKGTIDVRSTWEAENPVSGSGARAPGAADCSDGLDGDGNNKGGSGAAGGAFGGLAGRGGNSGDGETTGAIPGNAIAVNALVLQGGCQGGQGGDGEAAVRGGLGGLGGGAILLSSLGPLGVSGTINANGGRGKSPALSKRAGGGGGGSGGLIVLESPNVTVEATAVVVANAGGGAGGCNNVGSPCSDGEDGLLTEGPAAGGSTDQEAGIGGRGGSLSTNGTGQAGEDNPKRGGAGGGGGVGYLLLIGEMILVDGDVVSPAHTEINPTDL